MAGKGQGRGVWVGVGALKSITMKSLFSYLFGSLDARDKCTQRAAAGLTGAGRRLLGDDGLTALCLSASAASNKNNKKRETKSGMRQAEKSSKTESEIG